MMELPKIDQDTRVSLRVDDRRTGRVTVLPFTCADERDTWLVAMQRSARTVVEYDAEAATLTIHAR